MSEPLDLDTVDRLLTTTRSVRKRLDLGRPVDLDVVRDCLRIALQAATGGNVQRWRWVVVTDPDKRRRIGELYATAFREILAAGAPPDPGAPAAQGEAEYHRRFADDFAARERLASSVQHLIDHMGEVPVHVVPCVVGRIAPGDTPHWISAQFGSVYPAVWNLQLALRSRGLGSCITGAHLAYEREVAEILEIPYDQVMQICLLPVAYFTGETFRPARRRPLEEVVFVDRFDAGSLDVTRW